MEQHAGRTRANFERNLSTIQSGASRVFFWLLLGQWAFAIMLSLLLSPYTWTGTTRSLSLHVELAVVLGGLINVGPLILLRERPTAVMTRQSVAVVQMLWSALFIHITGGRIETHFHIFGSLAFLAFYRDWRIIVTATAVVAVDHLLRGLLLPESVYGIANPEWWRFLEHAAWVVFEDGVLILGCVRSVDEVRLVADREASLEVVNVRVEREVAKRTKELETANVSLAEEMKARLQMETELRQAQKLEAVGRIASGVAHELNTPIQFVGDSVHFLRDAFGDLSGLIGEYRRLLADASTTEREELAKRVSSVETQSDLAFLQDGIPRSIDRSLEGLQRVATIVRAMKEFAHPDQKEKTSVDLNRALESTLTIAKSEYKYVADLELYLGPLPLVLCHAGEVNQAFLNIVVNAAHAVDDVMQRTHEKGKITVRTWAEGDDVFVAFSDTGTGVPDDIRDKIFDPFFTTKPVGKGTGQGLGIARNVIVDKHGGELRLDTKLGEGSTFTIRLPVLPDAHRSEAA